MMTVSEKPIARKNGLVVQEMSGEVLVYDLETNKAHSLNESAATVWKNCDGNNSIADLTKYFKLDSNDDVSEDFVWLAIDQLNELNLLESKIKSGSAGLNRREVIRRIGLATVVALPLVASLTAPSTVFAAGSCACTAGQPVPCGTTACPNPLNCNGVGVCAP
jgi:hypothetical protein